MDSDIRFEVAVIGGGPAGSAAALALARAGRRVLLLERQRFPRFHIGESLLPATNRIFRDLGVEDRIRAASFVEKRGASFVSEDGSQAAYIDFAASPEVEAPRTYQVLRSRFDQILLDSAAEAGVTVRQECRVRDVRFAADHASLELAGVAGDDEAMAQVVIDASGQSGFLAKRLELREVDDDLRHVALYAHYEGIPRPPGERSGDIRVVSRRDMGWIWLIPVSPTVTSVGVVMSRQAHANRPGKPAAEILDEILASTQIVAEQMDDARRVSEARYEADFSYSTRAYAGDRWLMAGDAGSFLDPVFSSGVLLALQAGTEAAGAVDRALAAGDLSRRAFATYDRLQRGRYRFFRRFARGFYDRPFRDLFLQPSDTLGILEPLVSVLAGNWPPPLLSRLKLRLFFGLVAAQRYLPLAPRSHEA